MPAAGSSRRHWLRSAAVAGGLLLPGVRAMADDPVFSVVETADGRVRGLKSGGIHVFKGLRYGADTGGANRFMPPQPVARWAGVRDATAYGNYAPQMPADRRRAYADLIAYDLQPGGMGEDCLVLNLWTPSPERSARRPVLVHLHGGGFYAGSGNSPQFDGEMLARFGNAVFVTLNHRLGSFGYLNLAGHGGERYAHAGTAGMLDVVAGLKWVRENIEAFGGDPSRVLVFGQSGGGLKAGALMAMPAARGLFHRAGVMSGSGLRLMPKETSHDIAGRYLAALQVGKGALDRLHQLPMEQLLAVQVQFEQADRAQGEAPRAFSPVVDGVNLPRHPFDPDGPAVSAAVPMIIGTTFEDRAYRQGNFGLDQAGLLKFAEAKLASRPGVDAKAEAPKLVAMYRDEDPKATPYQLQARIDTDTTFRLGAQLQAERKAAQQAAPVWTYLWKTPSPAFGGRYGAPHGVDIGPSLHDIRLGLNGPSDEQMGLADQLASAWVSFAASGDPNNARTPAWAPYTREKRTTLVFDGPASATRAVDDPRRAFRTYWLPV
ncbi:carboxylesterase/lipase family protein [Caenimonas sedimenti]|uniref:Carboxylic ester hydrolase n=2 Tax=Caenimonas sedimenti TaxID=2596921 RepID=A0A562ZJP2_9BURK|nr:carboxylesterase/lipase family protein [Caenimonas sedimenti]